MPTEVKNTKLTPPKSQTSTPKVQPSLPQKIFGIKVNTQAIFDTIMSERATHRQGTHEVKNRSEVRGGGRKPWKQKGTGRARAGSTRGPIWVGGGRAFGPTTERNYTLKVNKKVRRLALLSALTLKAKAKEVYVHEFKMKQPSTKTLVSEISKLKIRDKTKVLIVTSDENIFKSSSNLQKVITSKINSLSVEALVNTEALIISAQDVKILEGMVK